MSKKKNRQHQNPPTPPPPPPKREPTAEQLTRLDTASTQAEALNTDYGPAPIDGVVESAGPTLEESLKRVEGLLGNARVLLEKARSQEGANKAEEARLANLKRDQEEAHRQRKKNIDEESAAAKKESEQKALDLLTRIEAVDQREAAARAKEAEIAEQSARLAERELNAEQGFLTEKARVLKPVEEEVKRLRGERDSLDIQLAAERERAEEERRATTAARAAKWAEENAQRRVTEAEARRRLDEEIDREREKKLDALRVQLALNREQAEAEWQAELKRRTDILVQREADADARERKVTEKQKAQRALELDLQVSKELHDEDRAGLDRKVERLVEERTEKLRHETETLKKQLHDARSDRDAHWKALEARVETDRRIGDRSLEDVLAALTSAEKDRDTFAQQLRERPDARAAERLAQLERERSAWLEERAVLLGDLAKAQGELATRRLAAIELESLRKQKEVLEVHKQLLDGEVDELRVRVDELTRKEDHRNPMTALTNLDEKEELQAEVRTTTPLGKATPTLKEFAVDLRHRIATGVEGRTLYYSDRDVRAFLGGLAMTRMMLLQGISGTGKTSLPLAFTSAVSGGIEVVEVQAGWRDRQDLVGYYNAFHRHYYATNFLQALYKAGTPAYRDRLFMIVLDEINLSRPEQFFADFLSALERPVAARRLTLLTDPLTNAPRLMIEGRHLPIPPNVWFIGTANHDETTAEFADKTYDRAHMMEMPRKTEVAHFNAEERGKRNAISYEKLQATFAEAAVAQDAAVQKATQWLRKASFAEDLQQRFRVGWGNRLEHQLAQYLPVVVESGGSVGEAMDHLLVTKVLRKLKDRHDVRATALEELRAKLEAAWDRLDGSSLPERCVNLIDTEIAAKKGEELA
ncbi:hypothetical protein [Corallococcus sp. AS-1-6]|uniref:hypothetical protein n=1 Tax=Corallococcus sp. AS-1-6 TaxID=2874599 RepID=UPI001CBAB1A3|nr:hypothetical protein [Corallococcus sp. AS-1-6]MBZ4370768.1 hypothetical protein [Corallococcus sp. AS-1-6]